MKSDPQTLEEWKENIMVVLLSEPGKEGMASWCCPICQTRFEGIPVRQAEEAAIQQARIAFEIHMSTEHAEAVETAVLSLT